MHFGQTEADNWRELLTGVGRRNVAGVGTLAETPSFGQTASYPSREQSPCRLASAARILKLLSSLHLRENICISRLRDAQKFAQFRTHPGLQTNAKIGDSRSFLPFGPVPGIADTDAKKGPPPWVNAALASGTRTPHPRKTCPRRRQQSIEYTREVVNRVSAADVVCAPIVKGVA